MNRLSAGRFVPPSVYIGLLHRIWLFVLLNRRSGKLCSMPWGVWGTVVSLANRSVGVLFYPAPPRPAAPPCAAPTRLARGMFVFWTRQDFFVQIVNVNAYIFTIYIFYTTCISFVGLRSWLHGMIIFLSRCSARQSYTQDAVAVRPRVYKFATYAAFSAHFRVKFGDLFCGPFCASFVTSFSAAFFVSFC